MRSERDRAKSYFDRVPSKWDAMYSHESPARYFFNRLMRRAVFDRYRLTFENCGSISGARVLDIGCGTGRYSLEFAVRGATRVVGIDFAPGMVDFSRRMAEQMNVADKCRFVCSDFSSFSFDDDFDIVLALGFFDYVQDPLIFLKKIFGLTNRVFLASFPHNGRLWRIQRKIRYHWVKGCPVYDYTIPQVEQLYRETSFPLQKIVPMRHGLFAVAVR